MKISVIIPTYRPQMYLRECLLSIDAQTLDKQLFEVIIVLNGEKEPYYTAIRQVLDSCSLISQLLYTNIAGVSNARNIGLDSATGDYICFIDDDDYVSPHYLAELLRKASPDTISFCYPYAFIDGNNSQLKYPITDVYSKWHTYGRQHFSCHVRRYLNGPCMKLIHSDIISNRRFDIRLTIGEDSLFMFLISDQIQYVDFTSRQAVYYRRYRENSAITSKRSLSFLFKSIFLQLSAYSAIYFKHPFSYNFLLYLSRVLGSIKSFLLSIG